LPALTDALLELALIGMATIQQNLRCSGIFPELCEDGSRLQPAVLSVLVKWIVPV
jgi:hypothetical protein